MSKRKNRGQRHDQQPVFYHPPELKPRNGAQANFMTAIEENDIVFGIGAAGTGKTYVSAFMAAQALEDNIIDRIVICRPAIQAAGEDLGYLPGGLRDKAEPYLRPMLDAFKTFWRFAPHKLDMYLKYEKIEIAPLAFMRGRTFENCWTLCDEAQNMNENMMKMLLTRLGENGKIIITGDQGQRDNFEADGFEVAMDRLSGVPGVAIVNFSRADVVRHQTVARILDRWDYGHRVSVAA